MTTQYASASYQEIIDLHTEADQVSVIALHTPNNYVPVQMLHGFWEQFRQFRYDGMSFSLVPSATLPADISQVSYGAGEAPIDPRDILNPVMFHGCHGEDLGSILNGFIGDAPTENSGLYDRDDFTSGSIYSRNGTDESNVFGNTLESLYYRCLTDNSWRKAHPQRGFRKSGMRPLVYQMVTNTPFGTVAPGHDPGYLPPAVADSVEEYFEGTTPSPSGTDSDGFREAAEMGPNNDLIGIAGRYGLPDASEGTATISPTRHNIGFSTGRLVPMGWRDTRSPILNAPISKDYPQDMGDAGVDSAVNTLYANPSVNKYHTVDKAYMGLILLPPAYKAEQYMRLIINHRFSFRRFRGAGMETATVRGVSFAPTYKNLN